MHDTSLTPDAVRAPAFFWATIAYTVMCLLSLVIFWFNQPPRYLWLTTALALVLSVGMIFQTWPHRSDEMLTPRLHRLARCYFLIINTLIVLAVALNLITGQADEAWVLAVFVTLNLGLTAVLLGAGLALVVAGLDVAFVLLTALLNHTVNVSIAGYLILVSTLVGLVGYWVGTRMMAKLDKNNEATLKQIKDERHLDVYFASQSEAHHYEIETLEEVNEALRQENGDLRAALEACQRQHHRTGVLVDTKIERSKGIVNFKFMNIEGERLPARMTLAQYRDLEIDGGETITATEYLHKTDSSGMYLFIKKAQKG